MFLEEIEIQGRSVWHFETIKKVQYLVYAIQSILTVVKSLGLTINFEMNLSK